MEATRETLRLFLCGDVMTGRGIDQVLAHPGDPELHEPWVRDARRYVDLAEDEHGPIPAPVPDAYPWGEALAELERRRPAFRIVNLETSITTSSRYCVDKSVHYRMHPANVGCLTAAHIDVAALANNHVLDWGTAGLLETLDVLDAAGIATAGAGRDLERARAPVVLTAEHGRVLVFSFATDDCGVPPDWAADVGRPGVWLLRDLSSHAAGGVGAAIRAVKRPGDVVVTSIHWGSNWGYEVSRRQREFAHALVEEHGVDLVHGHSSHHPRPFEVHRGKLILYGCGDFITDYEGIGGHEEFRGDVVVMYFVELDPANGRLIALDLVPLRLERFRPIRCSPAERSWLVDTLVREGIGRGVDLELGPEAIAAHWTG